MEVRKIVCLFDLWQVGRLMSEIDQFSISTTCRSGWSCRERIDSFARRSYLASRETQPRAYSSKMEKECWLKSWKFLRKRTNDRRKVCFGPRSPTTKPRSRWKLILPSSSFSFTDDKSLPMATERNNNALASRTRVFVKVCMCVRVYMCWHITDPV